MSILEIKDLQVSYGAVSAVRKIDLAVDRGQLVALLGANGAGKTTTLLAIAGALKPGVGTICFDGEIINGLAPEAILRKGIAMVPETRDVFPDLTVSENLRLGGYIHRKDKHGFRQSIGQMYDLFPILKARSSQPAGTLSGGEQQMLVIARAMMSRPKLLLLDEPSLGLAPTLVNKIFEMIHRLRQTDLTILLVEQNVTKALECAEYAYVLSLGAVAASGRADEIARITDLRSIYLGA
jgi:branched-chain amino acid transport system ATP-binding protein